MSTTTRSSRRALTLGVALLCSTALAVPALARKSDEDRAAHFAKRQAKMEAAIKERLAPKLELDEGQTARLIETLKEVGAERRAAHQKVRAESKKLKALIDAGANDGQLSEQMARLQTAKENKPRRGALLDETARFLTVQQQAKLTLILPKMMKHAKHRRMGKRGQAGERGERGEGARGFEGATSDF